MENQEKTIHTKASTALCTNAAEQQPVAFCVSKEPQKRHSSESLSKYASFLGKTGAVGPSAAEAPGFRPRRTAGKADVSRTRTGSHSCSRLVWSLQGHRYVSLCCDSTEVPGRASPGLRGAGRNLRGRRGRGRERAAARAAQSVNRWHAFFQRQAVHHRSRFSMPYTLRHFLPSPRGFLQDTRGDVVSRGRSGRSLGGSAPPEGWRKAKRRRVLPGHT